MPETGRPEYYQRPARAALRAPVLTPRRGSAPVRRVLAILAGFAAAAVSGMILGTGWLLDPEPPSRSDLIVVLAGGSGERIETALSLYRAGYGPAILVTSPQGYPALEFGYLASRGVPAGALIPPLSPSDSTLSDAVAIEQVVRREGFRSVLVVTSPYHCRRARYILRRVLSGTGAGVTVTPSISLYMDPERWWTGQQGWRTVAPEYPKLVIGWLSGTGSAPPPDMTGTP